MPSGDEPRQWYSHRYRQEATNLREAQSEASEAQDLRYVRDTILLLTGGCEICQHSTGPFCQKHAHAIKLGDPRCDDFARRIPDDPQKASRAQVQRFVNGALGITDRRSVLRLTGAE